jgi:hypothetical protein
MAVTQSIRAAASTDGPEVPEVPFRGLFAVRGRMPVSACQSLSWLLSSFAVSCVRFSPRLGTVGAIHFQDSVGEPYEHI